MIKIKTKEQIERIRKSCKLAANALKYAGELVQPGITTDQLDREIYNFIIKNGGYPAALNYKTFPKSTCISINEVVCHGIPNETVIQSGDIVKVDVATIVDGYFGDNCATFVAGITDVVNDELIDFTRFCLKSAIEVVKPNNQFIQIAEVISGLANKNGYSVISQYGGHGTGIEFHEEPFVSHVPNTATRESFKPGMIFTIEPMISIGGNSVETLEDNWTVRTVDKSISAQFEHTILVNEDGSEVLTLSN